MPNGILLYRDEIQYFNKNSSRPCWNTLKAVRSCLSPSTTENPYFYVYNAILSRSTVFEFKPVSAQDVMKAIKRALGYLEQKYAVAAQAEDGALEHIASACGGDIRKAMNAVELVFSAANQGGNTITITLDDVRRFRRNLPCATTGTGDSHYDILSAFQKSIRGSIQTPPFTIWQGF